MMHGQTKINVFVCLGICLNRAESETITTTTSSMKPACNSAKDTGFFPPFSGTFRLITPFILGSVVLVQSEFSTERDLVFPLSIYSIMSFPEVHQVVVLLLLPRLPVTSIFPSIFRPVTCFRRQFLHNIGPVQLFFLRFVACWIFLSSFSLCNTVFFSHASDSCNTDTLNLKSSGLWKFSAENGIPFCLGSL